MTKCGKGVNHEWFICSVIFLDYTLPMDLSQCKKGKKREMEITLATTIFSKGLLLKKKESHDCYNPQHSIDKDKCPLGRFKPDPKRINREKATSKKDTTTTSLLSQKSKGECSLKFSNLHGGTSHGTVGSSVITLCQMRRSCLLSIKKLFSQALRGGLCLVKKSVKTMTGHR